MHHGIWTTWFSQSEASLEHLVTSQETAIRVFPLPHLWSDARIHTHNKTVYSEFLSPTDEFQNPWLCHVCLCCQVWTWSRSICVRSVRCVNVWRTPSGPTRGWDSSWRLVWLTPPEMEVRETKEFLSIMMRLWNSWSSSSSPNLW